jgi:hypothetical protein
MVRLGRILPRCAVVQAVLCCLLAGLVLTSGLPAPASLRAAFGDTMSAPSEGQDPLPDDTELPGGETPSDDEFGLQAPLRRRSQRLSAGHGIRTSKLLWSWTVLTVSRPLSAFLSRYNTGVGCAGHFLADGRALRLWFQSQTC